jgi:acyl-CoA thioesterase-2
MTAPSFDEILRVELVEEDRYSGVTPPGAFAPSSIYGGQLIAQAMLAACKTVDGRPCHSLHAYYIRAGDPTLPVVYQIERVRDGATFATRRSTARQNGKTILELAASFKRPEPGPVHQGRMPDVPAPDDPEICTDRAAWEMAIWRGLPVELRRVTPAELPPRPGHPPEQRIWFRAAAPLTDDPMMQQAALAYISDYGLVSTAMLPHGLAWSGGKVASASLDHALWYHRPSDMREWHLFDQHSPNGDDARGFGVGSIWRHDGVLVASAAQEGLMRTAGT